MSKRDKESYNDTGLMLVLSMISIIILSMGRTITIGLEDVNSAIKEQNEILRERNDLIKKNAMQYKDAAALYDTVQRAKPVYNPVKTK